MKKFIVIFLSLAGCSLFYQENIQLVQTKGNPPRIGIGFIENRDSTYSAFLVKNFIDYLQMEIIKNNYAPLRITARAETREDSFSVVKRTNGNAEEILPDKLKKGLTESDSEGNVYLLEKDIKKVCEENKLKFFFQGSIGHSRSGDILEEENYGVIFLFLFDMKGQKIAAVNLNVAGKNLENSLYLQAISRSIIRKMLGGK